MPEIEQRQLGASGLSVPTKGVGVWSWGEKSIWGYGKDYNRQDISEAFEICLDAGLNFFDNAESYGGGESERLLGECHREDDRPITIATKFAPLPNRTSGQDLLTSLDNSLARLGIDHVDLLQIHFPPPLIKVEKFLDAMIEAVKQGKVRAVGVSNFNQARLRHAHAYLAKQNINLASNQVRYSLLYRYPAETGFWTPVAS